MLTGFFVPTSNINFKNCCVWLLLLTLCFEQAAWAAPDTSGAPQVVVSQYLGSLQNKISGSGDELIINIQDAHSKLGAQESIAEILDQLVKNYDMKLVALEGATGPIDTSLISLFPDKDVRRKSGEKLLKAGRISAGEFYSITSGGRIQLYGAEDRALYTKDLGAFRELVDSAPKVRDEMARLRKAVSSLEAKVHSGELASALQNKLSHGKADVSFENYWKIAKEAVGRYGVTLKEYPRLSELEHLFLLESKIDFKQADQERQKLLSELSRILPKDKLSDLFLHSLDFKRGRITSGEYHQYLMNMANSTQVRMEIRHLPLYTEYVSGFDRLDLSGVLREAQSLDDNIIAHAIRTPDEEALVKLRLSFDTIARCLATALTGSEYATVTAQDPRLDFDRSVALLRRMASMHAIDIPQDEDLTVIRATLPIAKLFYQMASARDRALLDNTLVRMRRDGVKVAALVSGGFHSQGIAKGVEGEDVSCLVVMPKFDEARGDRPYVTVLTKKPKEFETIFRDLDTFIVAEPLFALNPSADSARNFESIQAQFLSDARISLGDRFPRAARLYLRNLARIRNMPGRLDTGSLKTIGWIISGAQKGQNLRRARGGVLVEFPDGHTFLADISRDTRLSDMRQTRPTASPAGARLAAEPGTKQPQSRSTMQNTVHEPIQYDDVMRIIHDPKTDPLVLKYTLAAIRDDDKEMESLDEKNSHLVRKFLKTFAPPSFENGIFVASNFLGVQASLKRMAQSRPEIAQMLEFRITENGARLSKDLWGWKIFALVAVATALSVVTPYAAIAVFGCGVFSQMGPPQPEVGAPDSVISKIQRAVSAGMARRTKQRGSQALGGAALVRFPRSIFDRLPFEGAQPEEVVTATRPQDREGFAGIKLLNERGFDIVRRYIKYWNKLQTRLKRSGYEPASVVSEIDHSRLATGGGNSVPATHPHQHLPTRRGWIWHLSGDTYVRTLKLVQNMIVHNGDFNGAYLFDTDHSNGEIRGWLERVLGAPYGAKWWSPVRDWVAIANDTIRTLRQFFSKRDKTTEPSATKAYTSTVEGDSPGIAGMMDLLITKGNWYASLRAAYQFTIARSMQDEAPSSDALTRWTDIVETEFAASGNYLERSARRFSNVIDWNKYSAEEIEHFLKTAEYFFLHQDGHEALKSFMRMTVGIRSSTYGLEVATTLDPTRKHYAAYKQPFYVGYNPSTGEYRAGSDLDTVYNSLSDDDALILRLNQERGEVFTVGLGLDRNTMLYSIGENRELASEEVAARWVPKNSPYLRVNHLSDTKDRVRRDLEATTQLAQNNHSRWTKEDAAYDPKDFNTFHLGTADHFYERLVEQIDHFEELQKKAQKAGIYPAVSQSAPDIVIIGIENSLIVGQWWADLLQEIFPLLRDRIRVIPANEFVLDPNKFTLGPNTIVWNISRSGQTFPSFHSTVETVRLRDQAPGDDVSASQETGRILEATETYLRKLESQRAVKEVFVMTRDLGSEMAAVLGQGLQPTSPFLRTVLTDGGQKSDSEPASQSVIMAYQTLAEMTLYTARKLRQHYPNGSSPLGLRFQPSDLNTLEKIVRSTVERAIPQILAVGTASHETADKLDKQGRLWGRSIQESGWYTLVMKAYVFSSVFFKASLFGYWLFQRLGGSVLPLDTMPAWIFAAGGVSALMDAVFYTWGTELLTYLDRLFSGRPKLARHGTRTVKIFSRRTNSVLDVFLGKMFSEAPTYFSVFRRHADPVNNALQHEAYDVTAGTLVLVTVPDGRLSADLAKEEDSTRMAAVQTQASGNRLETTPEVVLLTTNPKLASLKQSKHFQNVLVIPTDTYSLLHSEGALSSPKVADRMGDVAYLVGDTLALLTANYRLLWAAADQASNIRLLGHSYSIWDTSKTPDQANVHTTAAPNAPEESLSGDTGHKIGWIERAFPDLKAFSGMPALFKIGASPSTLSESGPARAKNGFISTAKRLAAGLVIASVLMASFLYLKNTPTRAPDISAVSTAVEQIMPITIPQQERQASPTLDTNSPQQAVSVRNENFKKMIINYKRAANEDTLDRAGYFFRAAERRASRELAAGEQNRTLINEMRSKAQTHLAAFDTTTESEATPETPITVTPDAVTTPATPVTPTTPVAPPVTPNPVKPAPEAPAPPAEQPVTILDDLFKPSEAQATLYVDVTNLSGLRSVSKNPAFTFGTFDIWAKSPRVKLGVTFEGNFTNSGTTMAGTIVPKLNAEVSLSSSGSVRVGIRKTIGDTREPRSIGVMTTFKLGPSISFSPEAWISTSGTKAEPARNAMLFSAPLTAGPISVTPTIFRGSSANMDWQVTGSFDKGSHHIFAAKNLTDPLVMSSTFLTPDTGKFRLGYAHDLAKAGLKIGVYGFNDPVLKSGVGIFINRSVAYKRAANSSGTPTAGSGGPPPPPKELLSNDTMSNKFIKVGLLMPASVTQQAAMSALAQTMGPMTDRLDMIFANTASSLIDQGADIILDADSLTSGDTKLTLLKALSALDQDSLDVLKPFMTRLVSGRSTELSDAEKRAILSVITRTFPTPAPRKILLTSQGPVLEPELMRLDNSPDSVDRSAQAVAELLDKALFDAMTQRDASSSDNSLVKIKNAVDSTLRYLSDSEPRQSPTIFASKLRLLIKALPTKSGARLAAVDPSYKIDLSSIQTQVGRTPQTIFTDLAVFIRDGGGMPFVQRMKHLDRQSQGLFRHVLLVRDPQISNKQQLLKFYPAAAVFGNNIIFAPGLTQVSDLVSYRDRLSIERNFVVLAPRPGVIAIPRFESPYVDRALVVALDERAESSVGVLEQGALWLLFEKRNFRELVYLPPITGAIYEELIRIANMMRSAQEAA